MVPDMDLVIVRENTEGLYADRNMAVGSGEFMPTPDIALAVGVFTRAACERIARTAFALASRRRNHVTIVHKANVLTLTTGLFRDACRTVAAEYPHVVVDDEHVDAMAAHLVRRGGDFDVVVTENMFGDNFVGSGGRAVRFTRNRAVDQRFRDTGHGSGCARCSTRHRRGRTGRTRRHCSSRAQ